MIGGIPLGDQDRRPLRFPIATVLIIIVNVIVFIIELVEGEPFIERWALIPAHVASAHGIATIFTAMFMHAGWIHIVGNMVFFWAFGPEIEAPCGSLRYLVFYLLGGIAATLLQIAVDPGSNVPNLGASGAIAAVMGAFIVTYPRDRIRLLLIIVIFVTVTAVPAFILIGLWFLLQLFRRNRIADRSTHRRRSLYGACGRISLWNDRCPLLRAQISGGRRCPR